MCSTASLRRPCPIPKRAAKPLGKNQPADSSVACSPPGSSCTPYLSLSPDNQRRSDPDSQSLHKNNFTRTAETCSCLKQPNLACSKNCEPQSSFEAPTASFSCSEFLVGYSEFSSPSDLSTSMSCTKKQRFEIQYCRGHKGFLLFGLLNG